MPEYLWEGRTRSGENRNGEMTAANESQVRAALRRQNIMASSVKPKPKKVKFSIPGLMGGVKMEDMVIFTRQFSTMIDAGLPIIQCLQILEAQQVNPTFGGTIREIRLSVEGGQTLAEALRKHPKVFNPLYVNMVDAGEQGGILDTILNRLALYQEKTSKLVKQIKSAMTYPMAIVFVSILITIFLLVWVIPKFASVFAEMGSALPKPTQLVLDLSDLLKKYLPFLVPVAVVLLFLLKKTYDANKGGRRMIDQKLLTLPVIGVLVKKIAVARFTRTLGTLVSSGVPIVAGLEITARTSGNKIVEESVLSVIDSVKGGETISAPLSQQDVFPPMVVQMISIGEATGALDAMLSKIADFYDDEVDQAVASLTSLLEPMIMVVLGTVIGGLVIAMFMPIFNIADAVK